MIYSLNSLKGVIWLIIYGSIKRAIKGDARSLDYGSNGDCSKVLEVRWTPHPVIVTIRDNRDYIRVLLYS